MKKTVFGILVGTKKVEELISMLLDNGYQLQEMSIVMPEAKDLPNNYLQKLDLIDDIVGSRIGLSPVTIPGIENVYIGGPLAEEFGITATDETYDSNNVIIGSAAGGFINAMMNAGVNEESAIIYQKAIAKGAILFALSGEFDKDMDIMEFLSKEHLQDVTLAGR